MRNKLTLPIVIGSLITFLLLFLGGYFLGNSFGQQKVNLEWSNSKLIYEEERRLLVERISTLESNHRTDTQLNQERLLDAEKKYAKAISDQRISFDKRLRESKDRGEAYKHWLKNGTASTEYLASHAARLDRTLTEGRELVIEFRETLKLREEQLRLLGSQIKIDRNLVKQFSEQK